MAARPPPYPQGSGPPSRASSRPPSGRSNNQELQSQPEVPAISSSTAKEGSTRSSRSGSQSRPPLSPTRAAMEEYTRQYPQMRAEGRTRYPGPPPHPRPRPPPPSGMPPPYPLTPPQSHTPNGYENGYTNGHTSEAESSGPPTPVRRTGIDPSRPRPGTMYVRDDASSFPVAGTEPNSSTHGANGNGSEFPRPTAHTTLGTFMAPLETPRALRSPLLSALIGIGFGNTFDPVARALQDAGAVETPHRPRTQTHQDRQAELGSVSEGSDRQGAGSDPPSRASAPRTAEGSLPRDPAALGGPSVTIGGALSLPPSMPPPSTGPSLGSTSLSLDSLALAETGSRAVMPQGSGTPSASGQPLGQPQNRPISRSDSDNSSVMSVPDYR